jgi:hypothetical protein
MDLSSRAGSERPWDYRLYVAATRRSVRIARPSKRNRGGKLTGAVMMRLDRRMREAEFGVAEKICSEIVPSQFHSQGKAWVRLPSDDHQQTLAVESEEFLMTP